MRFILLLALIWPVSAFAQDTSLEMLCKTLPEYKQADGVEHVPGAEDVVPADINPLKAATPDVINIPIDVMLAQRFTAVKIPNDLELQPTVGMVSVHMDGRVDYNGQDISGQAYSLCGKSVVITEEIEVPNIEQGNGQQGEDILSSQPKVIEIKDGIEGEVLEGQNP